MFKIPVIKFEDHQLTSFAGLVIYQPLLQNLNLKAQLKKCFDHLKVSEIFGDRTHYAASDLSPFTGFP